MGVRKKSKSIVLKPMQIKKVLLKVIKEEHPAADILRILYMTGMRLNELMALRLENYDETKGIISIDSFLRNGEVLKGVTRPYRINASGSFKLFLDDLKKKRLQNNEEFFYLISNKAIRTYRVQLQKLFSDSGHKGVKTHSIRQCSLATNYYVNDLRKVKHSELGNFFMKKGGSYGSLV